MGVSGYINDIIEKYRGRLTVDISVRDLIVDFQAEKILSPEEVEKLLNITTRKLLNNEFLNILATRDDDDYFKFCKVLQRNKATAIKNFGIKLEEEALG